MRFIKNGAVFECSGREVSLYNHFVGIAADGANAEVGYGYDGHIPEDGRSLTVEEAAEMAAHMIARWQEWAATYVPNTEMDWA